MKWPGKSYRATDPITIPGPDIPPPPSGVLRVPRARICSEIRGNSSRWSAKFPPYQEVIRVHLDHDSGDMYVMYVCMISISNVYVHSTHIYIQNIYVYASSSEARDVCCPLNLIIQVSHFFRINHIDHRTYKSPIHFRMLPLPATVASGGL